MSSCVDEGRVTSVPPTAGMTADASDASVAAERVDVLVIGEVLVDLVHRGGAVVEHPGGSPANVALGLGRLGADVVLLTDLGRDERGVHLAAHLAASAVRVVADSFSDRPTSTASAFIGPDGAAKYDFDVRWSPSAGRLALEPRIVHTGSIAAFLAPGADVVRNLLREIDAEEVTFDPNIRPALIGTHSEAVPAFEATASLASVVKLSDEDAAWLYPGRSPRSVLETIRSFGPRIVALTLGERGSLISIGDALVEVPGVPVEIVDTIGAGDTYMASLIASLLDRPGAPDSQVSTGQALEMGWRASCAAAVTVSRAGADLPSAADVDAMVARRRAPATSGGGRLRERAPY